MLHYQPRPAGAPEPRLGLVIGKKLLRRAVDRNRVKRCIREQFRLNRGRLPACDLIVRLVARPEAVAGTAIADDLIGLFARLSARVATSGDSA